MKNLKLIIKLVFNALCIGYSVGSTSDFGQHDQIIVSNMPTIRTYLPEQDWLAVTITSPTYRELLVELCNTLDLTKKQTLKLLRNAIKLNLGLEQRINLQAGLEREFVSKLSEVGAQLRFLIHINASLTGSLLFFVFNAENDRGPVDNVFSRLSDTISERRRNVKPQHEQELKITRKAEGIKLSLIHKAGSGEIIEAINLQICNNRKQLIEWKHGIHSNDRLCFPLRGENNLPEKEISYWHEGKLIKVKYSVNSDNIICFELSQDDGTPCVTQHDLSTVGRLPHYFFESPLSEPFLHILSQTFPDDFKV